MRFRTGVQVKGIQSQSLNSMTQECRLLHSFGYMAAMWTTCVIFINILKRLFSFYEVSFNLWSKYLIKYKYKLQYNNYGLEICILTI